MAKIQLHKEERDRLLKVAGKELADVYILLTVAVDHAEEAEAAIEKLGYMRNEVKMYASHVMKAFDLFFATFRKYLGKGDGEVILRDFEKIKPEIDRVLDINM